MIQYLFFIAYLGVIIRRVWRLVKAIPRIVRWCFTGRKRTFASLCLLALLYSNYSTAAPTLGFGCYSCVPWPSAGPGCWHCGDPNKITCATGQTCQNSLGDDATGCLPMSCICALNGGTNCGDYSCALDCNTCQYGAVYFVGGVVVQGSCVSPGTVPTGVQDGPACCNSPDVPCSIAGDADNDGCCDNVDLDNTNPLVCNCSTEGGDADGDGCCANQDCDDNWGYGVAGQNCSCPCDIYGEDTDGDGCCAQFDCDNNDPEVCTDCPEQCEEDADMDGCCDSNGDDIDPNNPEICSYDPCNGQDADDDGCCDDEDAYPGDPSRCEDVCAENGGDADGDGCCADVDPSDGDPETGCECDREDENGETRGGDADEDGVCDDIDCDPEDPEKSAAGDCCLCEYDPEDLIDEIREKLDGWFPAISEIEAAARQAGPREEVGPGDDFARGTISVWWPGSDNGLEWEYTLDPSDLGFAEEAVEFAITFVRSVLFGYAGITFVFGMFNLIRIL